MRPEISEGLARADALPRLAQAHRAAPQWYKPALWISYGSSEAILLAIVLLVVAGGFTYAGTRLRTPLEVTRPGSVAAGFMIAILLVAIYTSGVATFVCNSSRPIRPSSRPACASAHSSMRW